VRTNNRFLTDDVNQSAKARDGKTKITG